MEPNQAIALAHSEARLRIEAASTILRMAVMFPDRMPAVEACERALAELDAAERITRTVPPPPMRPPPPAEERSGPRYQPEAVFRRHDLTDRQSQILGLVARGMTNNEIGKELFLSPMTVKVHLSKAFAVLGVKTRAQAVALMIEGHNNVSDT